MNPGILGRRNCLYYIQLSFLNYCKSTKLTACTLSSASSWSALLRFARIADNTAYLTDLPLHVLCSVSVLTVSLAELDKGALSSSCAEGM